jgi:hypothetical protein
MRLSQPEITITTPLSSGSGRWELFVDGRSSGTYDDFWLMADHLAARFDVDPDKAP